MTIAEYLGKFELTEIFTTELVGRMELRDVAKGEQLVRIGEELDYFFLLVAGKLKIYTFQKNGKKILIRFYRPLAAIGDLEYLSDYPPNCAVEALENSRVIAIPMKDIREFTHECPNFLRFVITQLSHKLYTYSAIASLNLVYPLENRVASYLWSISFIDDTRRLEEIRVNSLEEMTNLLATSYRHLSRVLNKLETTGVIVRVRGKIKIIDFNQLETLAVGLFE